MRILLTNDDGVDAPGLAALRRAVEPLGSVVVVAPRVEQSGCGHRVTTNRPISIERRTSDVFAIDGTPADCVRVALAHLDLAVDWVFAGVNAGGNLGVDVYHSGTVAAVREAALLGVRGCAFSHYKKRGREIDWEAAADRAGDVARQIVQEREVAYWNVNLPHVPSGETPEVRWCEVDHSPLPVGFEMAAADAVQYVGSYADRPRTPGADVDLCFSGAITASRMNATNEPRRA